jgi:hypothetical protein
VSFTATMRPSVSADPPGAKGAMMRTGFTGQFCTVDDWPYAGDMTMHARHQVNAFTSCIA